MALLSPRLRRGLKRCAVLAAVACVPLWIAGHFRPVGLTFRNTTTLVSVCVTINDRLGWIRDANPGPITGSPNTQVKGTITVCDRGSAVLEHRGFSAGPFDPTRVPIPSMSLPFWLIILILSSLAHLLNRRAVPGLCSRCDYNLAGLPQGTPCPECGHPASHV